MTTYLFYIAFTSFIVVMLIIGLFFITSMGLSYAFNAIVKRKVKYHKEYIHMHLDNPNVVSNEDMELVRKLISSRTGLLGYYEIYQDYIHAYEFNEDIRRYNNRMIEFKLLINNKVVRSKYRKSYILFLMSVFSLNTEEVIEYALNALDSESIYTRYNALKVIRNSKSIPGLLDALERMKHYERRLNVRVLVDFIDQFQGNTVLLNKKLIRSLDGYSDKSKKAVIFHFTNCQYDTPEARSILLSYLANETDIELLIPIIRYFEKVIDERAVTYLKSYLFSNDWEIRAASAKILKQYPSDEVAVELEKALMDDNYFVRYNSATSLSRMIQDEDLMKEILRKLDQPGRDSLLYAMNLENSLNETNVLVSKVKEIV